MCLHAGMNETPRWQHFERLAERVARDLAGSQAEVTWDAHLPGRESGLSRQIDVAVNWRDETGREYLTVIDCKDWSNPAGVNDIGSFASVVRDVGASQGILVCNAGFAGTVHNYARNLGLSLMNLHDAESEHWSRALTVPIVWTDLEPQVTTRMSARFEAGDGIKLDAHTQLRDTKTRAEFPLFDVFEKLWNTERLPRGAGATFSVTLPESTLELQALAGAAGTPTWRPIEELGFTYVVKSKSWLGNFRPERCRGLIDYLDSSAFHISYLPKAEIPGERGAEWLPIEERELLAVLPRGTYVTSEGFEIVVGSADVQHVQWRRLGD